MKKVLFAAMVLISFSSCSKSKCFECIKKDCKMIMWVKCSSYTNVCKEYSDPAFRDAEKNGYLGMGYTCRNTPSIDR